MGRLALTIWFTATALLGPGVCCCSYAVAKAAASDGQSAVRSARSCCDQNVPPCCPDGKSNHEPGKPSKCPCEKGQQAKSLPPAETSVADFEAQLKLTDSLFAAQLPSPMFGPFAVNSSTTDTTPPIVRPAGRDLLAFYSLLRC